MAGVMMQITCTYAISTWVSGSVLYHGCAVENSTSTPSPQDITTLWLKKPILTGSPLNCARRQPLSSLTLIDTSGKIRYGCRSVLSASSCPHLSRSMRYTWDHGGVSLNHLAKIV